MANEVTLYDIPSRGGVCWSLNPWKARLALNYKSIPYKTEWLEYPDIAPTLKSYSVPPNDPKDSTAQYSSPAVKLPDGTYVMESLKIARALEKLQPEPSLHLDNGYTERMQSAAQKVLQSLAPIGMPRIPVKLLNEASQPYFNETRSKRFGMSLPELAKSQMAGETAWKKAEPAMEEIKTILHEHEEGPYVMGKTVSYADFILVGLWRFVELLDEDGDMFGRGMNFDEAFPKHYEACKQWIKRDDH
ncbi:hypothetical protein BAUCODRAFT_276412 [Baudoinia panamericana UAMH 10762]|uniref:GST N-terminal domain-containing protein n=1 Tax=Baudoinia panamericana (strain UAMH 10762) TaxID=717646 RepID=M2ML66_BAUPA|nr:uncharacterized protein BAUCODRAFT_276412 [Baudoinia panamericana UAMH 10762]EMC92108.1 hypothetical protein BAUCODRAFT_276412 [Baudoinia panamericana UAMH 10762]